MKSIATRCRSKTTAFTSGDIGTPPYLFLEPIKATQQVKVNSLTPTVILSTFPVILSTFIVILSVAKNLRAGWTYDTLPSLSTHVIANAAKTIRRIPVTPGISIVIPAKHVPYRDTGAGIQVGRGGVTKSP